MMPVLVVDPLLGHTSAHHPDCPTVGLAVALGWPVLPVPLDVEVAGHVRCLV